MADGRPMSPLEKAWHGLGRFISTHMMIIVPAGVLLGILWPELLLPIKPYVFMLFAVMSFQNSLPNDFKSLARAFTQPKMLVVTLLTVHVVVPLIAFVLANLIFGAGSPTVAGVVLEYTVPIGVSTVMWIAMFGGDSALGLAALLLSTLISPFSIPFTLQLLVGTTVEVDALGMIKDMLIMVAIPSLAATAVNELSHGKAKREWYPRSEPLSRVLLPVIVSTNATGISETMHNLTPTLFGIMLFMFCCAVGSFVIGLGVARVLAKDRAKFVSTAFSCGMRNVSAGAVLATRYFTPEVMFPAVISTLFQQFLAAAFGRVIERLVGKREDGVPGGEGPRDEQMPSSL